MSEGEYEAGLELLTQEYLRLQKLNPDHELLQYGFLDHDGFTYDAAKLDEASRLFAKDGVRPRGEYACAYMFGKHYDALKKAADQIESQRVSH